MITWCVTWIQGFLSETDAVTPPFMQITCHTLSTSSRFRGDQTCWQGWSSTAPPCSRFPRMTRLTPSSRAFLQPRNTKVKHSVCLFSGPCRYRLRSKEFVKILGLLVFMDVRNVDWSSSWSAKTSQMLPSCGWTENLLTSSTLEGKQKNMLLFACFVLCY